MGAINFELYGTLSYRGYIVLPGGIIAPKASPRSDFGDPFVTTPGKNWLKRVLENGVEDWSNADALEAFTDLNAHDFFDEDTFFGGFGDGIYYADWGDAYYFQVGYFGNSYG